MKENKLVQIIIVVMVFILGGVSSHLVFNTKSVKEPIIEEIPELKKLPAPEITDGIRGEKFGIDKNINEETIDNYLGREDSVYRDLRMLIDEGNYECIGGDSYLSGIVKGFEAVPFPHLVNVTGLPEEVGDTYQGVTLFTLTDQGEYIANYEESMDFLEYYFPKDKNIFLMCGGGGYSGMMKNMLLKLGWDKNKVYNTGAHWSYEGKNNVEIKREEKDNVTYDFWKVTYHTVDFDQLNKVE